MEEHSAAMIPPYGSFRTLLNFLDKLESGGIPQRIDRSYWGTFLAGGAGPLVIGALKWFNLIDGPHNEPTPLLERLVQRDGRKEVLAGLLRETYKPIFASGVDLARTTTGHLDQTVKNLYHIEGDTKRKAISFLLHAAEYAELPLSSQLGRKMKRRTAAPKRTVRNGQRKTTQNGTATETPAPPLVNPPYTPPASGNTRTVTFENGGTFTVSFAADLFTLTRAERDFVLDMIDRMNDFNEADDEDDLQGDDASRLEATA